MVKKILRTFVIESTSLYLVSQVAQGLFFARGTQSLLATGLALTFASFLVKPIISTLLLPINLITFNVFKWANHAITLFLVDMAMDEFSIGSFRFNGLSSNLLDIPPIFFEKGVVAYLAFSALISVAAGVIYWLIDKK